MSKLKRPDVEEIRRAMVTASEVSGSVTVKIDGIIAMADYIEALEEAVCMKRRAADDNSNWFELPAVKLALGARKDKYGD